MRSCHHYLWVLDSGIFIFVINRGERLSSSVIIFNSFLELERIFAEFGWDGFVLIESTLELLFSIPDTAFSLFLVLSVQIFSSFSDLPLQHSVRQSKSDSK